MPTGHLLAFALVVLILVLIPGPSVLFVVTRAVTFGRSAAFTTVLGNTAGQYLQVAAAALGIGILVERSVLAFSVVKLAGAAYLVVLGVGTFRHRHELGAELAAVVPSAKRRRVLRDGLVVGVTNPKTAVFFAVILPQCVVRSKAWVPLQILLLGLVWVAIALVVDSCWGLLAACARRMLAGSPGRTSVVGGGAGVVTASLGLGLAMTGNRV